MKKFDVIKTVLHVILAILVFIFNEQLVNYVPFLVGGVMLLYAFESIYGGFTKEEKDEKIQELLEGALLVLFAVIMLVDGLQNFATACLIWAVWSIYREGSEIFKKVAESKRLVVGAINALESVIVIVFSILLIGNPTEHHALTHVILLGFELFFAVAFPIMDNIEFAKNK